MDDLLKPYKLSKCNLIQALEWIAFGYEPVRPEDEVLEGRKTAREALFQVKNNKIHKSLASRDNITYIQKIHRAMALLSKQLIKGKLTFNSDSSLHGLLWDDEKENMNLTSLENFNANVSEISASNNYQDIYVYVLGNNYSDECWVFYKVSFSTKKLKKAFPNPVVLNNSQPVNPSTLKREYTTPYLDIIDELIAEKFYKNPKLVLKDNLTEAILEKAKQKGIKLSRTLADRMATIMRTEEQGKGGYINTKKQKT